MNLASINKTRILTDGQIVRGQSLETAFKQFKFGVKDPNTLQTARTKALPNGNFKRQYISYFGDDSISIQTKMYGPDYKLKYQSVGNRSAEGETISFATKTENDGLYYQDKINGETPIKKVAEISELGKTLWEKALIQVKRIGLNVL